MGQDCKYCGAYIAGSADKCPACGKRVKDRAAAGQAYAYAEPEAEKKESGAEAPGYTYNNTGSEYHYSYDRSGTKPAEDNSDAKENQLVSYLSYIGILFIIPLLLRPDSQFARFHANQGLVLFLANVIIQIICRFIPVFSGLCSLAGGIFVFACILKGLINVYHLEKKELPIIGNFKLLK